MYIKQLRLSNFRNYKTLTLDFNPKVNVFVGNNAQGKSNILEAVYLLAAARSFRAAKDGDMIQSGQDYSLISGDVVTEATHNLEVVLQKNAPKVLRVDKKETQQKQFVGVFNVVLFTPDDLYLIKGSPGDRRRFLDLEISQVDAGYRSLLLDYQKVLQHRNSLLKTIAFEQKDPGMLEIWDQQLIEIGSRLIVKRAEMIHKLGLLSRLMHRGLSNGSEELMLRYIPFFVSNPEEENEYSYQAVKSRFTEALLSTKSLEYKRGYTLVGPQRDDFQFLINRLDAKIYGSQGQQRTAVLACRLAELEYMKSETGSYPAILLDDVMSELDQLRRHFLLELLHKKVQTIITTTNIADFEQKITEDVAVYHVKAGQVQERR